MGHNLLEHLLVFSIHVAKQVWKERTYHYSLLDEKINIEFLWWLFDQLLLHSCFTEDFLDDRTAFRLIRFSLCKSNCLLAPNIKCKLWVIFYRDDFSLGELSRELRPLNASIGLLPVRTVIGLRV